MKVVESHIACPVCPSSDAYCTYEDGHGYCFSCQTYIRGDSTIEPGSEYTYEFLGRRGITPETFRHFGCQTKIDREGKPVSLGFHYPNGATKVRLLDKKDFHWSGTPISGLFGKDKFDHTHKYVTITEGELDACSLYQVLRTPVVSVQSAATAARDAAADRSWLNQYERIYLAFDNDSVGQDAAAAVARIFDYNKIYVVKFTKHKDANEYLEAGESTELKNIWWNSRKYQPLNIISSFEEFKKAITEEPKKGISYPFPTLDSMTYGIRTGETVLITAQEGVGKTEIMHCLEHHILKETSHDIGVGAIYLEEPKRRHLQAIAGIELSLPVHLPSTDCTDDQVLTALESVVGKDDRLHVYNHFGSDDPDVLLDTIRFLVSARQCSYIMLDHITMAVSGLQGEDERKALDYLATQLAMMVKALDFALIIVSHVNDTGQTRGSRYISKIADIRVDLHRDLVATNELARNTTVLSVPKNRFSGKTGPAGTLIFDPVTWTYREELLHAQPDTPHPSWNDIPHIDSPSITPSEHSSRAEEVGSSNH